MGSGVQQGTKNPKEKKVIREMTEGERKGMFKRLIHPQFEFIRNLVSYYSDHPQNVEENYYSVLFDIYKGLHTYKEDKPLKTWLHQVVKNNVRNMNKKRSNNSGMFYDGDIITVEVAELKSGRCAEKPVSFAEDLSDEVQDALVSLPHNLFSVFMAQLQGYDLKEIAAMECENGNMSSPSVVIVRNRIHLAKVELRKKLAKYARRQ